MLVFSDAEIDFTNIRHYHHEIELIARANEKADKPITAISQNFLLDIKKVEWTAFNDNYERLTEEHALPLLFLIQETYSDIERTKELDNEVMEVKSNLTFLYNVLKLQESSIAKLKAKAVRSKSHLSLEPKLFLKIQSNSEVGAATLESPTITNLVIQKVIEVFKNPSYNYQLASHLQNVELTSINIKEILDRLDYRKSNIEYYCTADTAYRILSYLNAHTNFNFTGKYASNQQCRFIFDILQLFNLLKHIVDLKDTPRDKTALPEYKTRIIKTLLKNHKYVPTEIVYESKAE
jgi:hypothetical protein